MLKYVTIYFCLIGVAVSIEHGRMHYSGSYNKIITEKQSFRCDYTYFSKTDGWFKMHRMPANWHEARSRCHAEGGNLASPINEPIKDVMKTLMAHTTRHSFFTGIHAAISKGDFSSIEGTPLWKIPHEWAAGEPNFIDEKDSCVLMNIEGKLINENCSETYPYICYKKNSDSMVLNECGTIDSEYTLDQRTGSCYKFHFTPKIWPRAQMQCVAEGGYLAIINNDTEAQVLKEIFDKWPFRSQFWDGKRDFAMIGYHNWNKYGERMTVHGDTLPEAGYGNFFLVDTDINEYGTEFCGSIHRTGLVNDIRCDKPYAYICEKSPDSLLCH